MRPIGVYFILKKRPSKNIYDIVKQNCEEMFNLIKIKLNYFSLIILFATRMLIKKIIYFLKWPFPWNYLFITLNDWGFLVMDNPRFILW